MQGTCCCRKLWRKGSCCSSTWPWRRVRGAAASAGRCFEFAVAESEKWGGGKDPPKKNTSLTLWVDAGNAVALELYRSRGFRKVEAACGSGKEKEEEEEEEEVESSERGLAPLSLSLSEAARTLWHRALCRFFLCTSCWVRLALPLKGEAK